MSASNLVEGIFRSFVFAMVVAFGAAISTPARGDIVYTWVDDSHSGAGGYLKIASAAQAVGSFTADAVVYFDFFAGTTFHSPFFSLSPTGVSISTANAGFTDPSSVLYSSNAFAAFKIDINSNYATPGEEKWTVYGDVSPFPNTGDGHWVISGASAVPEPSSLILVGTGLVLVAGSRSWKASRVRRVRRMR